MATEIECISIAWINLALGKNSKVQHKGENNRDKIGPLNITSFDVVEIFLILVAATMCLDMTNSLMKLTKSHAGISDSQDAIVQQVHIDGFP